MPYSGFTTASTVRLAVLSLSVPSARAAIVVLQAAPRLRALRFVRPALALVASQRLADHIRPFVERQFVIPPVVDSERFTPGRESKVELREGLAPADGKPLVVHVGHVRTSRNLDSLAEIARCGRANVVVVASTATPAEHDTLVTLRRSGVTVLQRYLPDIERLYQAADVYVFPVVDDQGAIEVPLTVLEALATGI
ncbi:MAG: glycosyltransferase, partial [Chloroflexia bacterium]|nr:glycosyltransferase [Chloroflexia bacterium]